MKLTITHQDSYSRGELLLRTFFGFFYILIPHGFVMMFVGIWSAILSMLTFWVALFTGTIPRSWFDFQIKFQSWGLRLNATLMNLIDGTPAIGVNGTNDKVSLEVNYPESVDRLSVLLRGLFGAIYVGIPHVFCLMFRMMWGQILFVIAWWVVLFTGEYPESWHEFQVGTLRWQTRLNLYLAYFTNEYPPFSGKE